MLSILFLVHMFPIIKICRKSFQFFSFPYSSKMFTFQCFQLFHITSSFALLILHIYSVSKRLSSNSNSSICLITFWYPLFIKKSSISYTSKVYRVVLNESSTSLRHASPLFSFHSLSRPSSLLFQSIFFISLIIRELKPMSNNFFHNTQFTTESNVL